MKSLFVTSQRSYIVVLKYSEGVLLSNFCYLENNKTSEKVL